MKNKNRNRNDDTQQDQVVDERQQRGHVLVRDVAHYHDRVLVRTRLPVGGGAGRGGEDRQR